MNAPQAGSGAAPKPGDYVAAQVRQAWADPGLRLGTGTIILAFALIILAVLWRAGSTFAKWFLILLIVGTLLARWDNTFRPWLFSEGS